MCSNGYGGMKSVPAKEGCGSQGVIGVRVGEHQFHYSPRANCRHKVCITELVQKSPWPRIGRALGPEKSLASDWPIANPSRSEDSASG